VINGHRNAGYERLFGGDELTFGLGFPLTESRESQPCISTELELASLAESLGFHALWARDVPLYWPRFGDAGQTFDTWPWLSHVAAETDNIALGTSSVVLPLRHPLHIAKSAATVDQLSHGRLVMGVATGDRDPEFPAFGIDAAKRGSYFREAISLLRTVWQEEFPTASGYWGELSGDLCSLPSPTTESIPLLPTGHSRQSVQWIAEHGDGWLFYHLPRSTLDAYLSDWRRHGGEKPYVMVIRAELAADPTAEPEPIHQGYHAGIEWFAEYFTDLDLLGVDHVIIGLSGDEPREGLDQLADAIL